MVLFESIVWSFAIQFIELKCILKFIDSITVTFLFSQLQNLGETIEHHYPADQKSQFSAPVSPMRNVYLPQALSLVQVKLRIGHTMARNAAKYIRNG